MNEPQGISHARDDEIDLIELAINLWQEKWVLIACILLSSILGITVESIQKPNYKIKIQLVSPTSTELKGFNRTEYYHITSKQAFKAFITTLESSKRKRELLSNRTSLDISINKNQLDSILSSQKIKYPNTSTDISSITPENYFISYQGSNKNDVATASQLDLNSVKQATIDIIRSQHNTALTLKIEQLERADLLKRKILNDQLDAEITYLENSQLSTASENKILMLKKELLILKNNHLATQLKNILNIETVDNIQFYDIDIQRQIKREEPQKLLIIAGSVLLGIIFGFLAALARIAYKNYKQK